MTFVPNEVASTSQRHGSSALAIAEALVDAGPNDARQVIVDAASKRFYVDRGLAVAKSFGRKYVEFATPSSPVKLALYGRRALAKDAGVSPDGTGSHRLMLGSDGGPFTGPNGFAWEAASP